MPTIALGVNAVVVCVPPNAFTCGLADPAVSQIGGTFPGARSVTYLDGYFRFTAADLGLEVLLLVAARSHRNSMRLDFASRRRWRVPNILRRVLERCVGELYADRARPPLGGLGMTPVSSSGLVTSRRARRFFPFRRRAGGVVPYGTSAAKTAAICDTSVFWITNLGMVMRSNGYAAVRVSTHAIENVHPRPGAPRP